jgi:hypothetical protein
MGTSADACARRGKYQRQFWLGGQETRITIIDDTFAITSIDDYTLNCRGGDYLKYTEDRAFGITVKPDTYTFIELRNYSRSYSRLVFHKQAHRQNVSAVNDTAYYDSHDNNLGGGVNIYLKGVRIGD